MSLRCRRVPPLPFSSQRVTRRGGCAAWHSDTRAKNLAPNLVDYNLNIHAGGPVRPFAWNGDAADDYMRLFYGPNAGAGNLARFRNAEFDALYDKSRRTADTAERNKLYEAMTKIISAQAPCCTNGYRISSTVVAPQIRGHLKNAHYFLAP
jgi:ABC-type transport system substrate-binding protein